VLVRLKERFAGRGLAGRLVGSTVVGELADTVLFCLIAFAGVFPTWGSLIGYTVTGYLYKVAVEVILLPVTLAVIRAIKRREPEYAAAVPAEGPPAVRQLRLVVAVPDYDEAVRFYRDELGLVQEEQYDADGGARVMILGAGRATLELSNPSADRLHRPRGDGRTGVSPHYRVAFEVDDATAVTDRLAAAGAELVAPPTRTPWDSLNARLQGPADVQLTVFTELAGKPA
jgi:catechol 2,3-dioxygenase-like lactoylglutathione lyase family enzyme